MRKNWRTKIGSSPILEAHTSPSGKLKIYDPPTTLKFSKFGHLGQFNFLILIAVVETTVAKFC